MADAHGNPCLRLGDRAPDFTAETSEDQVIDFHEWKGDSWALLISHPADFTPVCTTELGALAALQPEFERRDTKVIAVSVDPVVSHQRWLKDIEDLTGSTVDFPIVADPNRFVSSLYGMIHPHANPEETVRMTFVIGPTHRIELMTAYPDSTGRSFREMLRVVDSLQRSKRHGVATPAGWTPGEDVLVPVSIHDEEAQSRLPGEVKARKPYFRVTSDPGANSPGG